MVIIEVIVGSIKEHRDFMTKIVHISFSDSAGGAAIAAYRLHEAMLEHCMESKMIVYENL